MTMNCGCGRRHLLLGGLAAAVAPAAFARDGFAPGGFASTAAAQTKPHRIDVHHHLVPPAWVAAVKRAKLDNPPMDNWTPEQSLEDMDKAGTATSIVSPMPPHVGFLPAPEAGKIARESNEWARQMATDHPGRFGVFAMLPMPYVDESLKEIEYAFDTLKVDGVGMMTNYAGKWLGYPDFAPVFEELNRRKAVVYTHPMSPACCVNVVQGVPDSAVEWGTDTTRTLIKLIFSGASGRYGDVDFIFSHGGGVLTAVAERLRIQMVTTPPYKGKFTRDMVDHELNRFYYDTAQVSNEVTIQALAKLVGVSQIVFGSDFPYRTGAEHVAGLQARFGAEDLAAIDRANALRILPAWR
jgi:predicted TIM-barrel fold metal-dependent hydrolase